MSPEEQRFHDFVAARYGALLRTAYALTANHHDAEDLLQATLVKAAAAWHRVGEQPEPYVRRILYHENISRWRRRRVDEHATGSPPDRPAPGEPGSVDRVLVQRALARLREVAPELVWHDGPHAQRDEGVPHR